MIKRIAILGCENSHANTFLSFLEDKEKYPDIEVAGVFSEDAEAAEKLKARFGVPVLPSFDCLKGKLDGLVVTARHGNDHYRFARPYIADGIPMFIDKPITVKEDEAVVFMRECEAAGVRVTGGSCCIHCDEVVKLREKVAADPSAVLGGFVRAPINLCNPYGDFFFYAQHPVEILCEIFGRYPSAATAHLNGKNICASVRYPDYEISLLMTDGVYVYSATVASKEGNAGGEFPVKSSSPCFGIEFDSFVSLLRGGEMKTTYRDFIAPVFVMNALNRSLGSGREEGVNSFDL